MQARIPVHILDQPVSQDHSPSTRTRSSTTRTTHRPALTSTLARGHSTHHRGARHPRHGGSGVDGSTGGETVERGTDIVGILERVREEIETNKRGE